MASPTYLCSTCETFAITKFSFDWWTKMKLKEGAGLHSEDWSVSELEWLCYKKYKAVQQGAISGCEFCNLLTRSFEELVQEWTEQNLLPYDWPQDGKWRDQWWIHLELLREPPGHLQNFRIPQMKATLGYKDIHHGDYLTSIGGRLRSKKYPSVTFQFAASLDNISDVWRSVPDVYVGDDPTREDLLQALKWQLERCNQHAKCQRSPEQELPTRCIQILPGSPPTLRLKETRDQQGCYLILSHRWSDKTAVVRTTTANYDARIQGRDFDLQTLPKVFQDIVELAQHLEIELIWIDSLCIIQDGDDGLDWGGEVERMAQYYDNAYLTVAATVNSQEAEVHGLFPLWEGPNSHAARVPCRLTDGERRGDMYVYSANPIKDDHMRHVRESELLTRGWVFQEWLLSLRVVSFTPRGMFLECRSSGPRDHNGASIYGDRGRDEPSVTNLFLKSRFDIWNLPKTGNGLQMGSRLWYRMVEIYSGLKLSQPDKDRLLALAGLSKAMAHVTGLALLSEDSKGKDLFGGVSAQLPRASDPLVLNPHAMGGVIMYDYEHGMLWYPEKLSSTPLLTRRIQNVTTLSWASVLRPVFFYDTRPEKDHPYSYFKTGFQDEAWVRDFGVEDGVVPAADRPVAVNVDESVTATDTSYTLGTQIRVNYKASLLPVCVGKPLTDMQELKRVTELTLYQALEDRCDWWTLCMANNPHDTVGCAAFEGYYPALASEQLQAEQSVESEHPELPEVRPGQPVYGHIMYEEKRKIGSRVLGLGSRYDKVYTVLLLKRCEEENEFSRVGIGRLFGIQRLGSIPPVDYDIV